MPVRIDSSYGPSVPAGLIRRERGALHLILHPEHPRWLVANRLGKEVVDLCDGRRDVSEISRALGRRYSKEPDQVERDVTAFLNNLHKAGLTADSPIACKPPPDHTGITGVFLHLTARCNLRCIHCYVGDTVKTSPPDRPAAAIHGLIDDLADRGGRAITISGGEPFLCRDWPDIVRHAGERLRVTINTNGTLVTDAVAAQLAEIRPFIQVSLDGPDPATHDGIRGDGAFASALRGIQALKNAGLAENLILSMTLMKRNIRKAPEMIDFAVSSGIPKIRFLPLHRQGRARSSDRSLDASHDDYVRWFRHVYLERPAGSRQIEVYGGLIGFLLHVPQEPDEHWCSIGRTVVVDAAGDVHPCALLMAPEFKIGNISDMSLEEIGASPKLRGLASACLARSETIEKCRGCIWRNFCRASCPAFPYLEKGTFRETDEFCAFRQQLYEDAVFTIAQRSLGDLTEKTGEPADEERA
jgi:radical SAM protein with 4Fe4S-binding SPASM domain